MIGTGLDFLKIISLYYFSCIDSLFPKLENVQKIEKISGRD